MTSILLRFYGPAAEWTGVAERRLDLPAPSTLGALAGRIAEEYPGLGSAAGVRLAVNRVYAPLDRVLADGDEVAVIPPVSGG